MWQKNLLSWVLCLGMLLSAMPSHAQQTPPVPLTISSALARFAGNPFTTDDWVVEILELADGAETLALPLWGAGALAYPNAVLHPHWADDKLTMILVDRVGGEAVAQYAPHTQTMQTLIPATAGLTEIGAVSWAADGTWFLFSARLHGAEPQVMRKYTIRDDLQVLTVGRLAALDATNEQVALLEPDGTLVIFDLAASTRARLLARQPAATSLAWSPDGTRLAITQGAYVVVVSLQTGLPERIFDAYQRLEAEAQVQTDSAAWSRDGAWLAFTLNTSESAGYRSQVVMVEVATTTTEIIAERFFPLDGAAPTDPRRFLGVGFQARGAFLPEREGGQRSDL